MGKYLLTFTLTDVHNQCLLEIVQGSKLGLTGHQCDSLRASSLVVGLRGCGRDKRELTHPPPPGAPEPRERACMQATNATKNAKMLCWRPVFESPSLGDLPLFPSMLMKELIMFFFSYAVFF